MHLIIIAPHAQGLQLSCTAEHAALLIVCSGTNMEDLLMAVVQWQSAYVAGAYTPIGITSSPMHYYYNIIN